MSSLNTRFWYTFAGIGIVISLAVTGASQAKDLASPGIDTRKWTAAERTTLFALSLSQLPPLAPDASNRVGDSEQAAALGQRLFFDAQLSGNGKVSCASCHEPSLDFQDTIPQGRGVGAGSKRTMPIAGTAYSPWFFWDGRADSQWAQALGPLENSLEHGATRTLVAEQVAARYAREYARVFGAMPAVDGVSPDAGPLADSSGRARWIRTSPARRNAITEVYANVGKSIAAYERRVSFGRSRVDDWIDRESQAMGTAPRALRAPLSTDEVNGARLFVGRARCATCHSGPRMTDDAFHNTGVPAGRSNAVLLPVDDGRLAGARKAVAGEFSCTSRFSDARASDGADACQELRYADTTSAPLLHAYKTPSLRNVSRRAPYMDAGQFVTLDEVVAHYDRAPRAPLGTSELQRLSLTATERRQLAAFLRALEAPPVANPATLLLAPAR